MEGGARHIEIVELDVLDLGLGQGGVGQTGAFENRPREVGAVELCAGEVGAAEVRFRKIEPAQVETHELGIDEIRRQRRVGGSPLVPLSGAELVEMIWVCHAASLPNCGYGFHYTVREIELFRRR